MQRPRAERFFRGQAHTAPAGRCDVSFVWSLSILASVKKSLRFSFAAPNPGDK